MTTTDSTPEQFQRATEAIGKVPYAQLLGIELEDIGTGTVTLGLSVRHELTQNHGVVHGGALASLIDTSTALAILTLLEPSERVTTVDLTVSFIRPVTEGRLKATAKVLRAGRRLFSVSAELSNRDGKLIATALSTYIKV